MLHNVRVENISDTKDKAATDPSAGRLEVNLTGEWHADASRNQFSGPVKFPKGEVSFEADFPPFLGGEGRAPTPLAYCFYGAMCCYGATFATQAAMAGVEIRCLTITLSLAVDFRGALGLGDYVPLEPFVFDVRVDTDAPVEDVARVQELATARCPAIWAMNNQVPHKITAGKI